MPVPSLQEVCQSIEQDLAVKMYTREQEIVLHLYEFDVASLSDLTYRVRASHNTVCAAVKALGVRDVVRASIDSADRRAKVYKLAPWALAGLDAGYRAMALWFRDRSRDARCHFAPLTEMIRNLERMLGFPCFAPQYEILSILYDSPGLSNKGVRSVYNCSRSHFHRALGELVARGTIHRDLDERDRRVMKYRLDDGVSDALNNHFARSYRFFKARFLHGLPGALELTEDSCYTIC